MHLDGEDNPAVGPALLRRVRRGAAHELVVQEVSARQLPRHCGVDARAEESGAHHTSTCPCCPAPVPRGTPQPAPSPAHTPAHDQGAYEHSARLNVLETQEQSALTADTATLASPSLAAQLCPLARLSQLPTTDKRSNPCVPPLCVAHWCRLASAAGSQACSNGLAPLASATDPNRARRGQAANCVAVSMLSARCPRAVRTLSAHCPHAIRTLWW